MKTKETVKKIIKEKTVENYFHALLNENGIIDFTWDTAISCLEADHFMRVREVIFEFGGGKKMPLYFSTHDFLQTSDEARKYASSEEFGKYSLVNATLVESLAMKILITFFIRFYKPTVITKGFPTKESAHEWLRKLQEENNSKILS